MRESAIRLLVTDLDGTILGHRDDRSLYPAFKALIDRLRAERQLKWMVCTGRSYGGFRSFTRSLERQGILPDLVLARGGSVFERHANTYRVQPVNTGLVLLASTMGFWRARRRLKQMHRHLTENVRKVRRVLLLRDRFALRFATEESAVEALHWVNHQIRAIPALKSSRIDREIQVNQVAGSKGTAVRVLAGRLGLTRDQILVIGDSRSDRCMLDRRVAFYTGCPLNADDETKESVRSQGGHISSGFTLAGVIDVITATLDGKVSSTIPPMPEDMPRRRRSQSPRSRSRSRETKRLPHSYLYGAAVVVITLMVFASFGAIPFSGLIMKPVHILVRALERLF